MVQSEHIKITSEIQDCIAGSQEYSVTLTIINTSTFPIEDLQVINTLSAGVELSNSDGINNTNISELEDKKRRLIRDLERAVETAYADQRRKTQTFAETIAIALIESIDMYASIFAKRRVRASTQYWAEEALKIDEWEDVERLEKEVITLISNESFLPKAYSINKDKLKRVMSQLEQAQNMKFSKGISLPAGSSISIPFSFKAPHLIKHKKMDISFKVHYKIENVVHTRSITNRINILSSAFAVPTGGMLGSLIGYFIKHTLIDTQSSILNIPLLFGSVALGLVLSLYVARKPDTIKAINVEDLTGGLIIGVLTGLYSDQLLQKLHALL